MSKFKFSSLTSANLANVAKNPSCIDPPPANNLLKSANVAEESKLLANISKTLASHKSCHTSNLSKISNISNPQSQKQEKINALWEKADKLADFVDGDAPYEERIKHLPELLDMTESLAKLMGVKYTRI